MQILVGLGNPGPRYAANRHNIGFMALEAIARRHNAPAWRSRFQARSAEVTVAGEKCLLLCPETFMNNSGQSVGEALRFYKLEPGAVTVFYDELARQDEGEIRRRRGRAQRHPLHDRACRAGLPARAPGHRASRP